MSDDRSLLDDQMSQYVNDDAPGEKPAVDDGFQESTETNTAEAETEEKGSKSKGKAASSKKGAKLALIAAIGIVALVGNKMLNTAEEATSASTAQSSSQGQQMEDAQPVVPEREPIATGTVLDPAIEEFIDNSDPEPMAVAPEPQPVVSDSLSPEGQFDSGFFTGIEPEAGTFDQVVFEQDFVDEDYVATQLKGYVEESVFNAAQQEANFKIEQQAELIASLRQSVVALNSRLTELNEVVSSVELEVLLQKERPELSDLAIIVPDPTCDICSAKARFVWQQEPVIVANGSEWMGYNVRIESDYLSLVNGSVVHDFATNL